MAASIHLLLIFGYAALYVCLLARAVAQVLMGKLLGFPIHKVRVGSGEWKWRTSIAGIWWEFRPFPFGGGAELRACGAARLRRNSVLLVLVVLAVDGLMLWALVQCWPSPEFPTVSREDDPVTAFLVFVLFVRGLNMLCDLNPTTMTVDGVQMPTEGKLLQEYLTGPYPGVWATFFANRDAYEKSVARYQPDFELKSSFLFCVSPEILQLFNDANQNEDNELYDAAIDLFEKLLKGPAVSGGERARILDHMACIPVMHGHHVPWEKVLGWLREAQTLAPNSLTIRGTLGGALVQSGSYTEAIAMLTPLTTPENDEVDRTISSIYLAKAWDRQGDHAQAAQWMMKAIKSGGFEDIRNRILAELSPDTKARVL